MHSKIRHIIWDWNGTLFDDVTLCWEICREMVLAHGLPTLSIEQFRDQFTIPVSIFWNSLLGREVPAAEFSIIGEQFHDIYFQRRPACGLQAGVKEVIHVLTEAGISHSILSSHPQSLLESGVSMCEVVDKFILLTGNPGEGGSSKIPLGHSHLDRLSRLEVLSHSSVLPSEMLLIGDTVHDFELAEALGVHAALFSGGAQDVRHLRSTGAPILSTMDELLDLLNSK